MAPEILQGDADGKYAEKDGFAADIWSLGITGTS
jgi:hypothetical protein